MPLPGEYGFEVDADGNIALKNGNLTVEGTIEATNLPADIGDLTATIAELNILDGVTADKDELNVLDGITATTAELNILAGTTATSGDLNNILRGATAGKRLAFGVQATGAAQEDVPVGLTTVEAAFATMVGAPSLTHFWTKATVGNQTGQPAAGSIRINNYKPTANNNVTPIDATSPFGYVAWIALGE